MIQCFELLAANPRLGRKVMKFLPDHGGMNTRITLFSTTSGRTVY